MSVDTMSITLRDLREEYNKSRNEVAAVLNVTTNAVINYEIGVRSMSLGQVLALSKLYGCSAETVIVAQLESIRIGKTK